MYYRNLKLILVIGACIEFGYTSALPINSDNSSHVLDQPSATYDKYLSPNGPNATKDQLLQTKPKLLQGSETYTYVRCYYALNSAQALDIGTLHPASDYVWAQNSDGSYYELHGYWYADEIYQWKNMFYTNESLANIQQLCNNTVKKLVSGDKFSFDQYAANNTLSFNHTIWQNDNTQSNTNNINKIIVFGDSLSDTNNIYNASQWKLPNNSAYFQGRFSNGRVWTEYLAQDLGIPSYNWAIGGAAGDTQYLLISGFKQQVQSWIDYMSLAKNYDVSKSLFTILIGANDFVNYNRSVNDITNDLQNGLTMLAEHGAKYIIVSNLPNVAAAPVFHMGKVIPNLQQSIAQYNQNISTIAAQLQSKYPNLKITIFDSNKMLEDVLHNPSSYGIKNISDPCLDINTDNALNYLLPHEPRASCTSAKDFIFWDTLHITTSVHRIWATKVLGNFKP